MSLCSFRYSFLKTCRLSRLSPFCKKSVLVNLVPFQCRTLKIHSILKDESIYTSKCDSDDVQKKRSSRSKRYIDSHEEKPGHWKIIAYATAEAYDLRKLRDALKQQCLYAPSELTSNDTLISGVDSALHAIARYQVSSENRHFYYFEEGAVVMWNITHLENTSILKFLKPFEEKSYNQSDVMDEAETMIYTYCNQSKRTYIKDGTMYIGTLEKSPEDIAAERFTLSNAMALSVKLGVFEAILDNYINDIVFITDDLKLGQPLRVKKSEVLRMTGQLFSLRHSINLSTDLLDTPDFYWEEEHLESLYQKACNYFSIPRRTKVMNEKLSNCVELQQLVAGHLSDQHHVRLEWMIIVLITVEVVMGFIEFFKGH